MASVRMTAAVLLAAAGTALGQGTFTEWTIPTPNSQPHCVVADSKGRIWYAAIGANQVGMFDPATQEFREARSPTANSRPHGIAVDGNDVIWFTEEGGNKIGRVDPATFAITEYPLPNPNSGPHTPIWDGRGAIWFTEQSGNRIGRLTIATGQIEEFSIPTPNSGPYGIVADAEGNAWFCAFGGGSNRIGKVDARTGRITEYATPTANSGPRRPWIDSRGRIWITENRASKLAMFDPATDVFREWDTPTRNGQPYGIVVDRNDIVWYNEFSANTIVRFEPATERFTVYPSPGRGASIRIVAVDPSNRIWYGENGNSKVGYVAPQTSVVNAASYLPEAGISPGGIVAIFGINLAPGSQTAEATPLPRAMFDTTVLFNGAAAPLFFASGQQINAQVPFEVAPGAARLEIRRGPAMTVVQQLTIGEVSPGIFTVNGQGTGATFIEPARPGEFVSIFCTGLGRLEQPLDSGSAASGAIWTVSRPEVTIAGLPAPVSYTGVAPFYVGLYQVNVQVPAAPPGAQPLRMTVNGVASNTVTMVIR